MTAFLIISISIILILVFLLLFPMVKNILVRRFFKHLCNRALYRLARDEDYYLINNLVLDLGDKTLIHIDHLLCANKFLYIVSDRYLYDGIDGSLQDQTIFTYEGIKRKEIKNPVFMNELRTLTLSKYLNWCEDKPPFAISIVVTNNGITISSTLQKNVLTSHLIQLKDLYSTIKGIESSSSTGDLDQENLRRMVEHINQLSEEVKKGAKDRA